MERPELHIALFAETAWPQRRRASPGAYVNKGTGIRTPGEPQGFLDDRRCER